MGVYSHSLRTGETTRLDVDELGDTVTHQGWSVDDVDVNLMEQKLFLPFGIMSIIQMAHLHKVLLYI